MIHKIYIYHFLKADIKTIPPFLPTNKKYVKKTDMVLMVFFMLRTSSWRWIIDRTRTTVPLHRSPLLQQNIWLLSSSGPNITSLSSTVGTSGYLRYRRYLKMHTWYLLRYRTSKYRTAVGGTVVLRYIRLQIACKFASSGVRCPYWL